MLTSDTVAADVNIYSSCAMTASALRGNHENTEVGEFLRDYLDLDLEPITKKLKAAAGDRANVLGAEWLGPVPATGQRLDGQDHLDHYHGDFKKHKRCEICS
jgi:alkaline phosphatase